MVVLITPYQIQSSVVTGTAGKIEIQVTLQFNNSQTWPNHRSIKKTSGSEFYFRIRTGSAKLLLSFWTVPLSYWVIQLLDAYHKNLLSFLRALEIPSEITILCWILISYFLLYLRSISRICAKQFLKMCHCLFSDFQKSPRKSTKCFRQQEESSSLAIFKRFAKFKRAKFKSFKC